MTVNLPQRRLIPKWRSTAATLSAPDAVPLTELKRPLPAGSADEFDKVLRLWTETSDPGVMGDLLSFSVHPELSETVFKIGYQALRAGQVLTSVQTRFVADLAKTHEQPVLALVSAPAPGGTPWQPFQGPIRRLRALLRTDQGNPLALLDYAQLQAAVGKIDAAERAIRTALMEAPNNRIVLRTAARFFVHSGHAGYAHSIIRKHPRTLVDPWLMASEIALADAADNDSLMAAKGRRFLLDNKAMPAAHLTELAGAIAMRELVSGNMKLAREAQRKALLAPNDNVMAQAIDMQNFFGVELQSSAIQRAISKSSEAQVLQAWVYGSPADALKSAVEWHSQEPFSSRPVQLLTCILAYQGNLEQAQHWLNAGLLADPADNGLLINLAFVKTRRKDYEGALHAIKRLRATDPKRAEPYILATEGLTEYQHGNFERGDLLYRNAVATFIERKEFGAAGFCKLNQALYAEENGNPNIELLIAETKDTLRKYGSSDCTMLLKIHSETIVKAPEVELAPKRRLSQWVFDPATNTLTERTGVTSIGAPGLIVLSGNEKNS